MRRTVSSYCMVKKYMPLVEEITYCIWKNLIMKSFLLKFMTFFGKTFHIEQNFLLSLMPNSASFLPMCRTKLDCLALKQLQFYKRL